jgi:hypothetical protein
VQSFFDTHLALGFEMDRDKAWLSYVQRCRAGAWVVTGMCSGPDNKEYSCAITILSGTVAVRPIEESLVVGATRQEGERLPGGGLGCRVNWFELGHLIA